MFDAIEEAFDDVPSSIQHAVIPTFGLSIRARRDNGLRARSTNGVHEGVRVVTFVSNHGTPLHCRMNVRSAPGKSYSIHVENGVVHLAPTLRYSEERDIKLNLRRQHVDAGVNDQTTFGCSP